MRRLPMMLAVSLAALSAATPLASGRSPGLPLTVSPQPGTPDASADTQISLLGPAPRDIHAVTVTGSRSGRHRGRLLAYAAVRGASFVPTHAFAPGEQVTVRLRLRSRTVRFRFTVAHPSPLVGESGAAVAAAATTQSFVSRPDLHPPAMSVKTFGPTAPGYFFLTPATETRGGLAGQIGPLILDVQGGLVWSSPEPAGRLAVDLRVQTYLGRRVLTWWEGRPAIPAGVRSGEDVIVDSSYRTVARVRAGNGYQADPHDFALAPDGTAYVLAYAPIRTDLSRVGGTRRGPAFDAVVQAVDVRSGLVTFEWHALGHVPVTDTHARAHRRGPIFDPYHVNSIDLRAGTMLVSMRNTWAAYDVSERSGRIVWQLGGRHSSYRLGRGALFRWQHDVRALPGGRLSIFDNNATPGSAHPSRGIVLRLDRGRRRATLAAQYRHPGRVAATHEGNVQALPGGGVVVGWGTAPYFSEFGADGRLVLDARFPLAGESYRAYLLPWSGQPSDPPAVAAHAGVVYASWNGATAVAAWQVLSGSAPATLAPVATAPRGGFETAVPAGGGPYYAVRALDASGRTLGTSAVVRGT